VAQFRTAGEEHRFPLEVAATGKVVLRLESRSIGYAADPLLVIKDHGSNILAETTFPNPGFDAKLTYTFNRTGVHWLVIHEASGKFGEKSRYQLTLLNAAESLPEITSSTDVYLAEKSGSLKLQLKSAEALGSENYELVLKSLSHEALSSAQFSATNLTNIVVQLPTDQQGREPRWVRLAVKTANGASVPVKWTPRQEKRVPVSPQFTQGLDEIFLLHFPE
jgi:hypothetical protein